MTIRPGHRVSVTVTQDYHKKIKLFLRLALHDIRKTAGVFAVGQTDWAFSYNQGTCSL
jgi:hypothetical protein